MSLTSDQAGAVRAPGSVAVTAGAGTGKTHMLTERYLHHLTNDGLRPLQIVAATFTDRAAAELRGRIRERLRGEQLLAHLAAELEAAQIGTLHSLAGRICREHPDAAGVPHDFSLQDELQQRLWMERHFRLAVAALPPRVVCEIPFPTLIETLRALLADPFTAERALAADPERWQELIHEERQRIFRRIAASGSWRRAVATLQAHAGPPGDKMELQRSAAVAAISAFESDTFQPEGCRALDGLHRGRGSAKAWGEETLASLKWACGAVRDAYREGKYAFELELGPADEKLRAALPRLHEAFQLTRAYLEGVKRDERILDFNDLEIHALRALDRPEVRDYYRARWKAFLVDEFQDTNPVQAQLLERLAGPEGGSPSARLTIVGDEKQSIYGFRRADLAVFRRVRASIAGEGGSLVELATSFRTHHALVAPLNAIVAPALGDLHQPLTGARQEQPGRPPFVSLHLLSGGPGLKSFRQRAEAHLVGELIEGLLADGEMVRDRAGGRARPATAGDIAILARTWDTLSPYGDELAARGVPAIHAGGGSLLAQREAKDATALLRFLADADDDLSLAAVLRSPFFAIDDAALWKLAKAARTAGTSWWRALPAQSAATAPSSPAEVLAALLEARVATPPSELLAAADELTGYSAVIANLPGGPRRLADWRGFREFVRQLERGHADVFGVVRDLQALASLPDGKVPRPGMEAGDAVSLMSVHNAKGLEWPIVIIPDITGRPAGVRERGLFEADAGVAIRVRDESGEERTPALYTLLLERRKQRDADEETRVLYVALTRARDRVILTGSGESGGRLESLAAGLEAAGVMAHDVPYGAEAAVPKTPRPPGQEEFGGRLLGPVGPGLSELPAASLSTYRICPKRFRFQHLLRHPGAGEVSRVRSRVGTLTHLALERGIDDEDTLAGFDPRLARDRVRESLGLAANFLRSPNYERVRSSISGRETRLALELEGVLLHGIADAVGDDFVLDYKTGERAEEDAHLLQVALYARALDVETAYLAYLRREELQEFTGAQLAAGLESARRLLAGVKAGDFAARPAPERCGSCAFESICPESAGHSDEERPPTARG